MDYEQLYRDEGPRALATLIRMLGDFDRAEDALQEAFALALERWPATGWPSSPRAWLVSTARHKAIDRMRREATWSRKQEELLPQLPENEAPIDPGAELVTDDMLRLIFTCCHPALAPEAQIALTLRTICGLGADEIARAFLVTSSTMAQRLLRAKQKIRKARIPYAVPDPANLGERLEGVLRVVYLVFNEGYVATSGKALVRGELCTEAIRLGRLLREILPREREVSALLALMLLQDSRREARVDSAGELVLLEDQDRSLWRRDCIAEGLALLDVTLHHQDHRVGFYTLQAAIAAVHARAERAEDTDWSEIATLNELLHERYPSPVIALSRAVAVAMAESLEKGLLMVDELAADTTLRGYHPLWVTRAELLYRLGRVTESVGAYREALRHMQQGTERRHVEGRLDHAMHSLEDAMTPGLLCQRLAEE